MQGLNVPKASEAKVHVINKILNSCELCSRFKNIKRVCIKCKPGFENPKALSTEVLPSDTVVCPLCVENVSKLFAHSLAWIDGHGACCSPNPILS